jgi:hypothetical protein
VRENLVCANNGENLRDGRGETDDTDQRACVPAHAGMG